MKCGWIHPVSCGAIRALREAQLETNCLGRFYFLKAQCVTVYVYGTNLPPDDRLQASTTMSLKEELCDLEVIVSCSPGPDGTSLHQRPTWHWHRLFLEASQDGLRSRSENH